MTTRPVSEGHREELRSTAAHQAPIDEETLFSQCMGNVSFIFSLLDRLEVDGMQHVEQIVLHAIRKEPEAAADAAHTLRGMMATVGAEPVSRMAGAIETSIRLGDTSLLFALTQDLRCEMDRCLAYIAVLRKKHNIVRVCAEVGADEI